MSVVDPSKFIPHLVTWSTFNIFATCGLVALLIVTLTVHGLHANPTLLNLQFIFILTSSTNAALIWTGHALDPHPPFALCLFNAAANMSNVPLMAGVALTIVAKVWGTAMIIWHPRCRPVMSWIIWTPFLLAFPFIFGISLFIAGIALGLEHREKVFRGSPFYCVVNVNSIQILTSTYGAGFTLVCLILAAWTASRLFLARRHFQTNRFTDDPHISYTFALRVMVFSGFVAAAFVSGIIALTSGFSAILSDIILSSCGVGAFFIFATAMPILRFVFLCKRDSSSSSFAPRSLSSAIQTGSHSVRSRPNEPHDGIQEFVLSSLKTGFSQKPPRTPVKETEIHVTRIVETREDKIPWII